MADITDLIAELIEMYGNNEVVQSLSKDAGTSYFYSPNSNDDTAST